MKDIKLNSILDFEDELFRPPIFFTTLWDYPKQSYTEPGDLVCDPMAGSGTTIDVCREERRRVIAFDIVPTRKDIIQADARNLPRER